MGGERGEVGATVLLTQRPEWAAIAFPDARAAGTSGKAIGWNRPPREDSLSLRPAPPHMRLA